VGAAITKAEASAKAGIPNLFSISFHLRLFGCGCISTGCQGL